MNTGDLQEKLIRLNREIRLDEVCTPTKLGSDQPQQINTDESCFFKHSKDVQDMLQPLRYTFKCSLFHRALQKKAIDVQYERKNGDITEPPMMTIAEVATNVWQPVYDKMKVFVDELRDGSIRLFKIDEMLKHLRNNPEGLTEEIEKVSSNYVES